MSTHKTPKGNTVEINWRNHNTTGKKDRDYLLDEVDKFVDATRAYKGEVDSIAIIHHVTKNKVSIEKSVLRESLTPSSQKIPKKVSKESAKQTSSNRSM